MKLLAISTISTLAAFVAAMPANHMDLAKRAYVTSIAVETVTVNEESYIYAYKAGDTVNAVNNPLLTKGEMADKATAAAECNDIICPLTAILGDLFSQAFLPEPRRIFPQMISQAPPTFDQSTILPAHVNTLNLDAMIDLESVQSVSGIPVRPNDAARFIVEAFEKGPSEQSMTAGVGSRRPKEAAYDIANAIKSANGEVVDFASVAGNLVDNARNMLGDMLNDVFS
ncbi:hypothetical protein G6F46_001434 [Rhizopus delemar]|uniref:Uncharacterized protein n=2 Tax=Rhizopus TaxID=4842 RepID=A0A9P6Z9Z5_9FUNG|nr:hypothetical protein G6F43_005874 [Rhizopus delemar]KAG1548481.1 hypothetical protein G6F51_003635 [Rhizopus arrhizus]KAG1461584.1 hypothetical protein G6F55_003479 [Rhizopus delemar]KAG1499792.1 hypothetical protein G6F54_004165 [Rhizopus delemar]KAG1513455.1 hypothetical protein G6F53_004415 [Rhizopus delemar]